MTATQAENTATSNQASTACYPDRPHRRIRAKFRDAVGWPVEQRLLAAWLYDDMRADTEPTLREARFLDTLSRNSPQARHLQATRYEDYHNAHGILAQAGEAVCKGQSVLLVGERGVGKTRLATEMHCAWNHAGIFGDRLNGGSVYTTADRLFEKLRPSDDTAHKSERPRFDRTLRACGLLIIDEIHRRACTEWENNTLTAILDERYGSHKPTVLISNEIAREALRSLGASVADRMAECGLAITMTGGSLRGQEVSQ